MYRNIFSAEVADERANGDARKLQWSQRQSASVSDPGGPPTTEKGLLNLC